jgi:hypothetical protein
MDNEPIIRFEIKAPTLADLKNFTDATKPDLGCRAIPHQVNGEFVIDAYLPQSQLQQAQRNRTATKVNIRIIENATEVGRQRQLEVGQGNRFLNRNVDQQIPRGLGIKE